MVAMTTTTVVPNNGRAGYETVGWGGRTKIHKVLGAELLFSGICRTTWLLTNPRRCFYAVTK